MDTFHGYRRENGRVGVRNLVAVIPTSVTTSPIAGRIARESDELVRATTHQQGVSQSNAGVKRTERVLGGIGRNPNVAAALVVGLGVEDVDANRIADRIADSGTPVEVLTVREVGGVAATVEVGLECVDDLTEIAAETRREEADISELILGVECGGSDATSGFAANPATGAASDKLVEADGTVCISEVPEFIGAEHILADRCEDDAVREQLLERVDTREAMASAMGVDLRGAQPSPGNQEGGLTTLEEKSLGAIAKGGTTPVQSVVEYAERLPVGNGLVVMDTSGYDVASVSAKVAGGAQVIAFTTGRGSTTGNPIAPVIKVTGNPKTWDRMSSNMDVNASTILSGDSIKEAGERMYETILDVANGQPTAAEARHLHEFTINEVHPKALEAKSA